MRGGFLIAAPAVTLSIFLAPVAAGLLGSLVPAFGYFPALGGTELSLAPWRDLVATPGLATSIRLTLVTGFTATALALAFVFLFCAALHDRAVFVRARQLLAPLMAVPHVAVAIGLTFLITPSGWAVRWISPWLTGWTTPPDVLVVQDAYGLALVAGLMVKEIPFLLLMTIGALGQVNADKYLMLARSLGYGPVQAWVKGVLPLVYRQIRLPIYAVLAFSLSVVDMALVLAPGTPPPLAVQVFHWARDPDLQLQFLAAAGAVLQVVIVVGSIGVWIGGAKLATVAGRQWLADGTRGGPGRLARATAGAGVAVVFAAGVLSILGMAVWSVAWRWRYPDALPSVWTLGNWAKQSGALAWPLSTTIGVGLISTLVALALVLACLENEQRRYLRLSQRALWLLYVPLIVPQVGFLFGLQILLVRLGLDGKLVAVVWAHLLFVLPYVYLVLGDPYRALDERYARSGLVLGASPNRVFWAIKLPMLLRPVLLAVAVGFSVSVAQYLPTIFAGAGRFATLTTEAVTLASGADRRVMGVYVLLQAVLPLILFALALRIPIWLYSGRRSLQFAA